MKALQTTTLLFILLSVGGTALAQSKSPNTPPFPSNAPRPQFGSPVPDDTPISAETQHRLEIGRESDRQRRMVADTDHLLALATELKADMDKTTKDTLSIQVIKKAEEIEKLAHDIRQRMKN